MDEIDIRAIVKEEIAKVIVKIYDSDELQELALLGILTFPEELHQVAAFTHGSSHEKST